MPQRTRQQTNLMNKLSVDLMGTAAKEQDPGVQKEMFAAIDVPPSPERSSPERGSMELNEPIVSQSNSNAEVSKPQEQVHVDNIVIQKSEGDLSEAVSKAKV